MIHAIPSPLQTPKQDASAIRASGYYSPEMTSYAVGRLTEPRNYAPRTSGLPVFNEPPPKFDLGIRQQPNINTSPTSEKDDNQSSGASQALQPVPEGNSVATYSSPQQMALTVGVQPMRSEKLNMLTATPSGLPDLAVAMDPANFPFIESARHAKAMNHGVIRLKNVSQNALAFVVLLS